MKKSPKARKVKRQSSTSYQKSRTSGTSTHKKLAIRARERANHISMSKAKRNLVLALISFVLAQVVKFVAYSVIWPGSTSPTGIPFTIVIYLQVGLLLLTFIFFVMAIFRTLQRVLRELD